MLNASIKNLKPILEIDNPSLDTLKTALQISELRKQLKIPQKVMAIEMGISSPYLSDLEYGRRKWSMELFKKAKSALERISKD